MTDTVAFISKARKTIECDDYTIDDRTVTFRKGDEIVLIAVLENIAYLEQARASPLRSGHNAARIGLGSSGAPAR
jgi:hypothetical protein